MWFHNSSLTIPTCAYEIKDFVKYIKKNLLSTVEITIESNRNNSTVSILQMWNRFYDQKYYLNNFRFFSANY